MLSTNIKLLFMNIKSKSLIANWRLYMLHCFVGSCPTRVCSTESQRFNIFIITTERSLLQLNVNAKENLLKRSLPIDLQIKLVPKEIEEECNFCTRSTSPKKWQKWTKKISGKFHFIFQIGFWLQKMKLSKLIYHTENHK